MTTLVALPEEYVVSRYQAGTVPVPANGAGLWVLAITPDEVSLVCPSPAPAGAQATEPGWRCWRVAGQPDFSLVGVLHGLTAPLAAARVSVFAVSTFDTDYLLVRNTDWPSAHDALQRAGHTVPPFDQL
jgi:hypothetical protein